MNNPQLVNFYRLIKAAVHGAEYDSLPVEELGDILRPILFPDDIEYTTRDAAKMLNRSVNTLQRWRMQGLGPDFMRSGNRQCIYSAKAIRAYQASRERVRHARPTSALSQADAA
jgi:hypothetical protein